MHVINVLSDWQSIRQQMQTDLRVGFVPTMGNLHKGHSQLIQRSVHDNELTIVSIFVNDKQFNDRSDFINYPRTFEEDISILSKLGVNYCLSPTPEELYADGYQFQVHSQAEQLCGEDLYRPGHFTGVLTVVMKLLQLIRPSCAYFGEKDYQQLQLIQGMVNAFFMPIDIIGVSTLREEDGLPFSSRNGRLSANGRRKAGIFAALFGQNIGLDDLRHRLHDAQIEVEYLEDIGDRRLVAVIIDGIRLIDNRCLY